MSAVETVDDIMREFRDRVRDLETERDLYRRIAIRQAQEMRRLSRTDAAIAVDGEVFENRRRARMR
jgi:hypothetical protein